MTQTPFDSFLSNNAEPISLEAALVRAGDLLRCASATAYESGDQLTGEKRDLAFSVVHLVDMARVMVERSLVCVEGRQA
jgi:hypothetical protein